jgi:hypothetical protein
MIVIGVASGQYRVNIVLTSILLFNTLYPNMEKGTPFSAQGVRIAHVYANGRKG